MAEMQNCKHLHMGSKANLWCAALQCCRHILTLVTIECDYLGCHFICQLQTYGFLGSHSPSPHMLFLCDSNCMQELMVIVVFPLIS